MSAVRQCRALTRLIALALFAGLLGAAEAAQPGLTGDTRIHDPSVIQLGGRFAAFGTGEQGPSHGAIRVKTSQDGVVWKDAGAIGNGPPKWAVGVLGYQPGNVWAPSVTRHGGEVDLYYALSTFGGNASAIGLMTNVHFDPEHPVDGWEDQGLVLTSDPRDDFNAIDPFRIDLADGRAFLAWGSYWSGIKLSQLDPASGKLLDPKAPPRALATRREGVIEAPAILEHDGRFFLFVSFDQCCKGVGSTYNIRVGRADRIEGPYFDKDGKALLEGGGSLLLSTTGAVIGPGGQEPVPTDKGMMLAYHFYDGAHAGRPTLALTPLRWTAENWPALDSLPQ